MKIYLKIGYSRILGLYRIVTVAFKTGVEGKFRIV